MNAFSCVCKKVSLLATALLVVGCGDDSKPGTTADTAGVDGVVLTDTVGGDDVAEDTGAAADTTAPADTVAELCGEARPTTAVTSGAIVNGTVSWDPNVVSLDDARGMAVGAVIMPYRGQDEIDCTGTLVAPNVVLTAAHCVVESPNSVYSAGMFNFAVGPDVATPAARFAVSEVHAHPSYDYWGEDAEHDVAVLILAESATARLGAAIAPIPVNCDAFGATGFVGELIQVVGYGAIDKWGEVYETKQKWATEDIEELSTIDVTVNGHGVAGVCYADSGSPALFELAPGVPSVVGVLSWGYDPCATVDHYVRTDHECAFINAYLPSCGAVTETGSCDGDTAVYCASDAVVRDDCAARGELCEADAAGAFRCVPDPCAGETFAGRCDGTTAVWCDGGEVKRRECAPCAMGCGWVDDVGGYDCVAQ